jgi:hypothetical protein
LFLNLIRRAIRFLRRRSSTVEHLFCKQAVAGSNPIAGSNFHDRFSPLLSFHCPMV